MPPGSGWWCSGILSVLARVIVFLFGGRSEAEVDLQIGNTSWRSSAH